MTALPIPPLSAKIRQAIDESGRTKADIARELGVTKQSITGWIESGRISKPNLLKLAELLEININWFMDNTMGQDALKHGKLQLVKTSPPAFTSNVSPTAIGKRAIPVISAIQAGALKEIAQPYEAGDGYATVYADDDYSKWAFALEIEGESMMPEFRPGDIVIIEPEWQPRPGEYVAAKNGSEEATFKKYRPRGTNATGDMIFELAPLNEDYPTLRSDITPLTIIGVMAEHRRKARRR
jgi:SOS-response transcriptional repressor LexA